MIKKLLLIASVLCLGGCANNNSKTAQNTAPQAAPLPLVQALELIEKNNYPEAKKILEDYTDKRPANWAHKMASAKKVRVFFWDKEQLAECGLFEIAAANGKTMEPVLDESYSKAFYLLAFIALESRANPYANALNNLDKGLALEPDQPTLLYEKAHLYYQTKRLEKAVEEYNRLLQTSACLPNPQRGRAYRGLGEALVALAKYDDAEVALYQSLKYDPNNKKAISELDYVDQVRNSSAKNNIIQ